MSRPRDASRTSTGDAFPFQWRVFRSDAAVFGPDAGFCAEYI
jgi:hypothetical protein